MNRDSVLPLLDPAGLVHWIRRGQLLQVKFYDEKKPALVVVLDPRPRANRIRVRKYSSRGRRFVGCYRVLPAWILEYSPAAPDPVRELARQASA